MVKKSLYSSNVRRTSNNIPILAAHERADRILSEAAVGAARGRCGRLSTTHQVPSALHD